MLTSQDRLRVIAKLFTRPVFASLARTGKWEHACSFLSAHGVVSSSSPRPLSSIFEDAWRELKRQYRNEYVYKNELANQIVFKLHRPSEASLHVELPIGKSIVDVAIYNGTSTAYEIKTEYDSARRLASQTKDYLRSFERVYVVAHPDLAQNYVNTVAPEIGVLSLSHRGRLETVREAESSKQHLDHAFMFRCLRREEYKGALEKIHAAQITLPNGLIHAECERMFSQLSLCEAHALYVRLLRTRTTDSSTVKFVSALPRCLRALGYATPLTKPGRRNMLTALGENVTVSLV